MENITKKVYDLRSGNLHVGQMVLDVRRNVYFGKDEVLQVDRSGGTRYKVTALGGTRAPNHQ